MTVSDTAARAGRIGRTAVEALAGLLDIPAGPILAAGVLPPMWHCAQLPDVRAQAELGPDGHPLAGVPSPPRPGMRRMFAGGRSAHLAPLRIGAHSDRPYAATEGYPDLLVHGPLQVLVMAESLRGAGVRLAGRLFEYRLQSPAAGPQRLTAQLAVNERGADTVVLAGRVSGPVPTARVREP